MSQPSYSKSSARPSVFGEIVWWLVALALVGGTVCAEYGRAIRSPFIFDDRISVTENTSIVKLWPLWSDVGHLGPLNPPHDFPTAGRPLVNLSLALNFHFGGLDPAGYHVFNLIVHLLSAMLLLAIVRQILRLDYFGGRFERVSGPLALAVALLWAVHPLQTETVVYITQRTELLVGFFYLATLYGSLRYWAAVSPAGRIVWLVLATLCCLAGMACKEVMVTAPVIVLLFERTFIAGSFRRAIRNSWPLYLGLMVSWRFLIWLNMPAPRPGSAGFHLGIPATAWWFTQAKVLWLYLKLAVYPWPLSIHYDMPYLMTVASAWPWLLAATLLGVATLVLFCRGSSIGFVGAWVLLILSPTLVVPIGSEVAAERRMYLPLAALAALVVVGGYALMRRAERLSASDTGQRAISKSLDAVTAGLVIVLICVLSLASVRRLAAYQDEVSLWQDAADVHPDDPLIHYNLGIALSHSGQLQPAIEQYEQALSFRPTYADAQNNLGEVYLNTGQVQKAIEHFLLALRLKPESPEIHYNLGNALKQSGQLPEAIQQYEETLKLNPQLSAAHGNLGVALAMAGRSQEAIDQFQEAIKLQPDNAEAQNNLGFATFSADHPEEAIVHYLQAVRLKPDYTQAWFNLANAYAQSKHPAEAVTAANKALDLARSQGQTATAKNIEDWLDMFRANHADLSESRTSDKAMSPSP